MIGNATAIVVAAVLAFASAALAAETPPAMKASDGAPAAAASASASKQAFDPVIARRIEVPEVQRRIAGGEKVVLVDSRGSVQGTMLKGAVHVPAGEEEAWAKNVARDTLIVTYCA